MSKINLLQEFFNSKSDANRYLEASEQERLEKEFQEWYEEKSNDLEFAARPLIKHLAEKHHPHTMAVVESDGVKLWEGLKSIPVKDYIVD